MNLMHNLIDISINWNLIWPFFSMWNQFMIDGIIIIKIIIFDFIDKSKKKEKLNWLFLNIVVIV